MSNRAAASAARSYAASNASRLLPALGVGVVWTAMVASSGS